MKKPHYDVTGVGHAIVDILTYQTDAFIEKHELDRGSMKLVSARESDQLYKAIGQATECSGGSAANTMAGITMLGGKAAFIGKVANDTFGRVFTHDLNGVGVRYDTPASNSGTVTGRCIVCVTRNEKEAASANAERTMATYLGASRELRKEDVNEALIADSAVTYIEGYMWDEPHSIQAIEQAIAAARKAGRKIAFSLSDRFCVERHHAEFLALSKRVDLIFANEHEAERLFEQTSYRRILNEAQTLGITVVMTRSEKGSVIVTPDSITEVDAVPVDRVYDVTGAGDLYAAGFLYGYTHGYALDACGKLASRCASSIIQQLGARPMKPLTELLAA